MECWYRAVAAEDALIRPSYWRLSRISKRADIPGCSHWEATNSVSVEQSFLRRTTWQWIVGIF